MLNKHKIIWLTSNCSQSLVSIRLFVCNSSEKSEGYCVIIDPDLEVEVKYEAIYHVKSMIVLSHF